MVSTGSWKNKVGFWAAFGLTSAIGIFVGLRLIQPKSPSSVPVPAATPVAIATLPPVAEATAPVVAAQPSPAQAQPTPPAAPPTAVPGNATPAAAVPVGDWAEAVSGSPTDAATGFPKRVMAKASGIELVLIPPGSYERGSKPGGQRRWVPPDENPAHGVTIPRPFYLGATKVTQAQWTKVAGLNPSRFRKGGDFPVEGISFIDASSYLRRAGLRLPTEAEWEYACKAGGDDPVVDSPDPAGTLAEVGWYLGNSGRSTQPVNLKRENPFGLKDVLGDVAEWTSTWYDSAEYYRSVPSVTDPHGPEEGTEIVVRGCTFASSVEQCRCAQRGHVNPQTRGFIGLRVAHDAP